MSDNTPKATIERDVKPDFCSPTKESSREAASTNERMPAEILFMHLKKGLYEQTKGHKHAIAGGLIGLLIVILFFSIGFFRTLLLVIFVVAGISIGQIFDGNPAIIRTIRNLFENNR